VVFLGTILAVCWALGVLVLGRAVRARLSGNQWRALIIILVIALGLNWASKLIWLGM
jgi:hypothetical protein